MKNTSKFSYNSFSLEKNNIVIVISTIKRDDTETECHFNIKNVLNKKKTRLRKYLYNPVYTR